VADAKVDELVRAYEATYEVAPSLRAGGADREALREAARIEAALREFMTVGGFSAITDTFENLDGLKQLPGIAAQRLMADGYGSVRKATGRPPSWSVWSRSWRRGCRRNVVHGGLHIPSRSRRAKVLRAHMLEVCPSISDGKVSCEIHPLSIGGRSDPVRLVFDAGSGPAVVTALMDMGDRFRIVANEIDLVPPDEPMGKLPRWARGLEATPELRHRNRELAHSSGSHHTVLTRPWVSE